MPETVTGWAGFSARRDGEWESRRLIGALIGNEVYLPARPGRGDERRQIRQVPAFAMLEPLPRPPPVGLIYNTPTGVPRENAAMRHGKRFPKNRKV